MYGSFHCWNILEILADYATVLHALFSIRSKFNNDKVSYLGGTSVLLVIPASESQVASKSTAEAFLGIWVMIWVLVRSELICSED